MRQVLAAQDLDGRQVAAGRHDGARDQVLRALQEVEVASTPVRDGEQEGISGAAAGSADLLRVRGGTARQRGQDDGGQVADVDTHLQRGCAGEHIGVLETAAALERLLDLLALRSPQHPGVLGRDHLIGARTAVQAPVVVVRVVTVAMVYSQALGPVASHEAALATPVGRAGLVVPLVQQGGMDGLLPETHGAAHVRGTHVLVVQELGHDAAGLEPVHPH